MKILSFLIFISLLALSLNAQETTQKDIYQIRIDSYKSMQQTGQILSILGFAVGAGGGILYQISSNNLESETLNKITTGAKQKPWAISMITSGATVFLSGAVINLVAGRNIKQLQKKLDIGIVYNQGPGLMLAYKF